MPKHNFTPQALALLCKSCEGTGTFFDQEDEEHIDCPVCKGSGLPIGCPCPRVCHPDGLPTMITCREHGRTMVMVTAVESPTPGGEQAPRECWVRFNPSGTMDVYSSPGENGEWVRMREVLPEASRRGEGTKP